MIITVIDLLTFLSEVYIIAFVPYNFAFIIFIDSSFYFYIFWGFYSEWFYLMGYVSFFYIFYYYYFGYFFELLLSPSELNRSGSNMSDYFFYGRDYIFWDRVFLAPQFNKVAYPIPLT